MTGPTSIDSYIAAQPAPARPALRSVRAAIRKALPRAAEGISYQIPIYRLDGAMVLYFAGFKQHYSLYPATPRVTGALKKELAGRLHSKATIRFSYDEAVPAELIARFAKLRATEVFERTASKPAGKKTAKKKAAKKAKPRKTAAQRRVRTR